ncbi:MAG: hypothetical protein Q9166_000130 [cf. Caloplaca sp. 2 TL-2023]
MGQFRHSDFDHADSNYNPFERIRKASVYPEPEGDDNQKPSDPDTFVAELVRRGTRKLTFTRQEPSAIKAGIASTAKWPVISLLPNQDEEKISHLSDSQTTEVVVTPRSITRKQRAFLIYRQWRRNLTRIGLGDRWEVKPAIADIATSAIAFAPLSTTGHHLLPASARPRQTVVIEYEHQHQLGEGSSLVRSVSYLLRPTSLRVIYIQDDVKAFDDVISDFHICSPAFSRNRTRFSDWVKGENIEHLSAWQTAFWRPSYDRTRNVVRAAFGLEYLVPQLHSVSVTEGHSRFSKTPRLKATIKSPDDVHDNSLQRLSVYIQLPRANATSPGLTGPSSGIDKFVEGETTDQGIMKAQKAKLAGDNTVLIFDSHHKAIATVPLIAGEEPWHQLLDSLDGLNHRDSGYRLALAVVELTFESVAARWSHYILSMHNYIASLEERVYENPADDTRTTALWSVSKQLLQAERLLKFHVLLLENIQNDFKGLEQGDAIPTDWLQPNLSEFRRLSSEVEETLKKPTAHMVDLVSLRMYL